eukprot:3937703-Rhodomonas_salina.3
MAVAQSFWGGHAHFFFEVTCPFLVVAVQQLLGVTPPFLAATHSFFGVVYRNLQEYASVYGGHAPVYGGHISVFWRHTSIFGGTDTEKKNENLQDPEHVNVARGAMSLRRATRYPCMLLSCNACYAMSGAGRSVWGILVSRLWCYHQPTHSPVLTYSKLLRRWSRCSCSQRTGA